ncbi:MAG TPA: MYXO-CTERM sorting domain-containing protein [Kofleriaceae bacterium]
MFRPWLVLLVLLAESRDARACQCGELDEPAAIAASDVVFDGWVIEVPSPWKCPLQPAPKPRPGCVRIAVIKSDCKARGDLLGLRGPDETVFHFTDLGDDATTFCKIIPGRYQLSGSPTWIGDPDGTLAFGMAIDLVPGGSYVVYGGNAGVGQRLRVGVFDVIKGSIGREVTVVTEPDCGTAFMTAGQARRFFGKLAADGSVRIRGCNADKLLAADDLAAARVTASAPVPAPAAPSDASPPAAPPPRAKSGCAAGGSPGGFVAIALGLGVLARRRRRS